jgi:hypothetical protein
MSTKIFEKFTTNNAMATNPNASLGRKRVRMEICSNWNNAFPNVPIVFHLIPDRAVFWRFI